MIHSRLTTGLLVMVPTFTIVLASCAGNNAATGLPSAKVSRGATVAAARVQTPVATAATPVVTPVKSGAKSGVGTPVGTRVATPVATPVDALPAAVVTCPTRGLALSAGRTTHAAGSAFTTFQLTNITRGPCTMQGYPGVSMLDRAGHIVGRPAARTGPSGTVILIPAGERARFVVQSNTATQIGCAAAISSTAVQVYPPNQRTALRIPFQIGFCTLTVTAVTR